MAFGNVDVPFLERGLQAFDKPMMLALAGTSPVAIKWSDTGDLADPDLTDAAFPAIRALDGKAHLVTKPSSAKTTWYLLFDYTGKGIEIDMWAYMGHGLTIDGVTVTLEIADAPDFATNLKQISILNPIAASTGRRLDEILQTVEPFPQRYTNVEFLRIKMTKGATFTPELGEALLLRRTQLKHASNLPWDDVAARSQAKDFVSRGGVVTRYTMYTGQRILNANINPSIEPHIGDLPRHFERTGFGTRHFVWIDKPASGQQDFHLMLLDNPALDFPFAGPFERRTAIRATEQGPQRFFLYNDPEHVFA